MALHVMQHERYNSDACRSVAGFWLRCVWALPPSHIALPNHGCIGDAGGCRASCGQAARSKARRRSVRSQWQRPAADVG